MKILKKTWIIVLALVLWAIWPKHSDYIVASSVADGSPTPSCNPHVPTCLPPH